MSLGAFLDRLIGPGNYICTTYMTARGMRQTFFPRHAVDEAAKALLTQSNAGRDCWFALASFTEQKRSQQTAEKLKAFWLDADIKRPGDGKDPAKVFVDEAELKTWVAEFCAATGVPLPNLWVKSGYGVHLYWVIADALSRADWQPYADAFKALLLTHGAKGDLGVVADAARILRPIETFNYKVPSSPAPCWMMSRPMPDYANAVFLPSLLVTTGSGTGPSAVFQSAPSMAANAKAGLTGAPRDFAVIDQQCAQVARSLDEGGEHDGRQLWRGMLTLTRFCENGRDWAHEVGKRHPDYDPAKTDAEVDLIEKEYQAKGFGPTLCKTFDAERPGICPTCPLYQNIGKGGTPYHLGIPSQAAPSVNVNELPAGFRRGTGLGHNNGVIEVLRDKHWHRIISGDLRNPEVEKVGRVSRLKLDHIQPSGTTETVYVTSVDIHDRAVGAKLAAQGLAVAPGAVHQVGALVMGWIDQLMAACQEHVALPAFGWLHEPQFDGFAVGGAFFNSLGTEHATAGATHDEALLRRYRPAGQLDEWRKIAAYVIGQVPELHTALAVSFGAPLMELAGVTGGCVSFVGESGVGKTSVFRVGAGVWGHPVETLKQLNDTTNDRMHTLGQTKALPLYWDEVAVDENYKAINELLLMLTQGRDKGRLTSDIRAREHGTWQTMYALASNKSVTELIAAQKTYRSAMLARILEVPMTHKMAGDPTADARLAPLMHHYGHAGRVYARYIAEHQPQVSASLDKAADHIVQALGNYEAMERFHLGIAKTIVTGAAIARRLDLVPFDIPAIVRTLIAAMRAARTERAEIEPSLVVNLSDVLDQYLNARANGLIVTDDFKRPGPNVKGSPVVLPVGGIPRVAPCIHLATDAKRLRLDKEDFKEWAHLSGRSPREIFHMMAAQWGAVGATGTQAHRTRLGAGQRWSTPGRVKCVEIDLDQPALRHVLDGHATTSSALPKASNVTQGPWSPRSP